MSALQTDSPPTDSIRSASGEAARDDADARRRSMISTCVRDDVRAMARYAVTPAEGWIKLDAMENPYALPEDARDALAAALSHVPINRYPDGDARETKEAIRRSLALPDDVGLMLGHGSDEILQIITAAIAHRDAVVLAPEPSFVMYRRNAVISHARFVGVPLRGDFSLDMLAMMDAIGALRPALVWLALPNNPTGNLFANDDVERIIEQSPGLVAIDEAYYAFAERSMLPRVLEFPNVAVVRTVSKIGLAGLRLGYAVAHPAWIDEFEKVRPPYNVHSLTQAALPVLLKQEALAEQARAIRGERERLEAGIARLPRVTTYPTQTNFVLARVPDAPAWFETLRNAKILVKNLHGWHPLLAHCLRITVGTPFENDAVLSTLERHYA